MGLRMSRGLHPPEPLEWTHVGFLTKMSMYIKMVTLPSLGVVFFRNFWDIQQGTFTHFTSWASMAASVWTKGSVDNAHLKTSAPRNGPYGPVRHLSPQGSTNKDTRSAAPQASPWCGSGVKKHSTRRKRGHRDVRRACQAESRELELGEWAETS